MYSCTLYIAISEGGGASWAILWTSEIIVIIAVPACV